MMLSKKISFIKWSALFILTGGVAMVQLSNLDSPKNPGTTSNPLLGFFFVFLACIISGFAGVWYLFIFNFYSRRRKLNERV
jgi:drug/metabolite transporter (DMT)-like permease